MYSSYSNTQPISKKPIDDFFFKYNRVPSSNDKQTLFRNKFPHVNINHLAYVFVKSSGGGNIQSMDTWIKDTKTNNVYWFDYENVCWNNNEQSIKKLLSYGQNTILSYTL